jgi:hypothetical protein
MTECIQSSFGFEARFFRDGFSLDAGKPRVYSGDRGIENKYSVSIISNAGLEGRRAMAIPRSAFVTLGFLMSFVTAAWGQPSAPPTLEMRRVIRRMPAPGSAQLELDGVVATGSPYSCELTTETTKTAQDGTKFHHQSVVTLEYRDSQGRFRTESSLPNAGTGPEQQHIVIRDPVAQVVYMLDSQHLVARRLPLPATGAKPAQEIYQARTAAGTRSEYVTRQPLGPRTMEGVYVEGFRFVTNFPAGIFGNDRAFVVTEERWVAPEMALAIFNKRTDPRFGETVMRRTKIQRGEPDPALFQVPANYTVMDQHAAGK